MAGKKRKRKPQPAVDVSKVAAQDPVIAALLTMFLGESDVESFDDAAYRLNLKSIIERLEGKVHSGDLKTRTLFDMLLLRSSDHYEEQQTLRMHNAWVGTNLGNYAVARLFTHGEQATDKLFNLSEEAGLFASKGGYEQFVQKAGERASELVFAALKEMGTALQGAVAEKK